MSWLQHLYDTYEKARQMDLSNDESLRPHYHINKKAEIIITLNEYGDFLSAEYITENGKPVSESRTIPVTVKSASRTSGASPHPLCDEFKYIAGDFEDFNGKSNEKEFSAYGDLLSNWVSLDPEQILPKAVLKYITKKTLLSNLKNHSHSYVKDIFDDSNQLIKPKDIVLWRIQLSDNSALIESWQTTDNSLFDSWQQVCEALEGKTAQVGS